MRFVLSHRGLTFNLYGGIIGRYVVLDVGIVVKLDCVGEMSIWRAQLVSNLQDLPEDAI